MRNLSDTFMNREVGKKAVPSRRRKRKTATRTPYAHEQTFANRQAIAEVLHRENQHFITDQVFVRTAYTDQAIKMWCEVTGRVHSEVISDEFGTRSYSLRTSLRDYYLRNYALEIKAYERRLHQQEIDRMKSPYYKPFKTPLK